MIGSAAVLEAFSEKERFSGLLTSLGIEQIHAFGCADRKQLDHVADHSIGPGVAVAWRKTAAAVVSGKLGRGDIIANPRFGRRTGF